MKLQHPTVTRSGDEYQCGYCGKCWDINDSEPPQCEIKRLDFRSIKLRAIRRQAGI